MSYRQNRRTIVKIPNAKSKQIPLYIYIYILFIVFSPDFLLVNEKKSLVVFLLTLGIRWGEAKFIWMLFFKIFFI
jgi:hypothetical protein